MSLSTLYRSVFGCCLFATLTAAFAETFTGNNAPGTSSTFVVSVAPNATNLSIVVPGSPGMYSHILLKAGSAPSDIDYDFSAQVAGQTNAIYLELPELAATTYHIRVRTPADSAAHAFTLQVDPNTPGFRTAAKPPSKLLGSSVSAIATNSSRQYFRLELTTNASWRLTVEATNHTAPDLYIQRNQLPNESAYWKRSLSQTNDMLAFLSAEAQPGTYYIATLVPAGLLSGNLRYTLRFQPLNAQVLPWDPGLTHEGTAAYTNLTGVAGDYFFRVTTANPSLGAWRVALRLFTNDANVYLSRGTLPTPADALFKSERSGSDGLVIPATQFSPNEDWYILVRARPNARWSLVSGTPYVQDLGLVANDQSSQSGEVEIGPESIRFFRTTTPANILAWRLWLNGATNAMFLRKTTLPLPTANDVFQSSQLLLVPPHLLGNQQYFIGVGGSPGQLINLDSRQQPIVDLPYVGSFTTNITGFGYTTFRVQVPVNELVWQITLPSTNGNPNVAVRRDLVPNENYNEAYSELSAAVPDNLVLVPPVLKDGTFYITVYGTNAHHFVIASAPAPVTDIPYVSTTLNDNPLQVGWKFYRVTDIEAQLNSLGWDLLVTNAAPGTRIALRQTAAPAVLNSRNPSVTLPATEVVLSAGDFLQRPMHQAGVWYIGVFNPSNALGAFTLITRELQAERIYDNNLVVRTNVPPGRWEFFRLDVPGQTSEGEILGWDLRLINVTAGSPRLVVRRGRFPVSLSTDLPTTGTNWDHGKQWAADRDWTQRQFASDGVTDENGRTLVMAMGRPLVPDSYFIGVMNSTGTNEMSYSLLSRWIGTNAAIRVEDLAWNNATVTNIVAPREAKYYRVVIPNEQRSWRAQLNPFDGDAMLVVTTNWIPNTDSEKRMQKPGTEHYLRLPLSSAGEVMPGTYFLAVVGEGMDPAAPNRIGEGDTTFSIQTLGPMPEINLGMLTGEDLVIDGTLAGGTAAAYHFQTPSTVMGFWIFLENTTGAPWAVSRGEVDLADPGLGGDRYGTEGGASSGAISSSSMITVGDPYRTETIMVKARQSGMDFPDASYTLRVKQIIPQPMDFHNGTATVVEQPAQLGSYFVLDVPGDALGWDLRLTNVLSGSPQLVVAKEWLPIFLSTSGWNPGGSTNWEDGNRWYSLSDWTERTSAADGTSEAGRILAMGMGRPLAPGRYYVGVLGSGSAAPLSFTLVSRGIGPGYSIPVTPLEFEGGTVTVNDLAPREAAYYRVTIPSNTTSWKVRLSATTGDSLLIALKGAIPNVSASLNNGVTNLNSAGKKMQKIGDEQFLLLPGPGQTTIDPGIYYLAVVGEGQNPTANRIGNGASSFTLTSLGAAPVQNLLELGTADLTVQDTLNAGEVKIYQFSVPAGVQNLEARLEERIGNPVMVLRHGSRASDPGLGGPTVPAEAYGNSGGENAGGDVNGTVLNIANPTNGTYTLVVKARGYASPNTVVSNASYLLRLNASGASIVDFDGGSIVITNQSPSGRRYFRVLVPTNALGWDLRLVNVLSGQPRLVVRRETLPTGLTTTPWSQPWTTTSWPTNYQWAPLNDWTRRTQSPEGIDETGRILAVGMGRPLEPGLYHVAVINFQGNTQPMSYTLLSRAIGGAHLPVVDLPFIGSVTNTDLPAREAAYYRLVVPSNAPSWKVKLTSDRGESLLVIQSNSVPNIESAAANGNLSNGRGMQRLGNEHFLLLPVTGSNTIPATTNYLVVVGEGVNPTSGRVGSGSSSFVLSSLGPVPVANLGLLTSEDLVLSDELGGGESKAYQFTVPPGMYGMRLRLTHSEGGNPALVLRAGTNLPDPGASLPNLPGDAYGNEGGYTPTNGHTSLVTLANPVPGVFSVMVKARQGSDARYTLHIQEILVPEVNFSTAQNVNGLTNSVSGQLLDNERAFFKFYIPGTNDGRPVIGWKLDLVQSSGQAWFRVRRDARDLLPSDPDSGTLMNFTAASAIIAPPYLTSGVWYVEVKGSNFADFTLTSNPLELQRPAWTLPPSGQTNVPPGLNFPAFGDTGIAPNGQPLPGDQGIDLQQGSFHYYAFEVPATNSGLVRVQLDPLDHNPDVYLRFGHVPTLYHDLTGKSGNVVDRSMTLRGVTEYANWVPIDGKTENQLAPGLWYLAVHAADNTSAKYRLRLSAGTVTDLPLHGVGVTNQTLASNDWRYYRVQVPATVPFTFNLNFTQEYGDIIVHTRDTIPPGNGAAFNLYRDWTTDQKNNGPYSAFDQPGSYTLTVPPVRPGQVYYFGVRAKEQAIFNLSVTTNAVLGVEPTPVAFYDGRVFTNVPPFSHVLFRIDVPAEAVRLKFSTIHSTNLALLLEQGTVPVRGTHDWPPYVPNATNSSLNNLLVAWNPTLRRYVPAAWPWVAGQPYFLMVTNTSAAEQLFSLVMDGRNAENDDSDGNQLLDAWEYYYFGRINNPPNQDADKDGVSNLDEFLDGTDPTSAGSFRPRLYTGGEYGIVLRNPDLPSYALGSQVTLQALPASGYAFIGWTGDASGTDNPLLLTMDGAKTVIAKFKLAGDDFITAFPLVGSSVVTRGTNVSMTKEPGEPFHAGNPGGKSIWWRWLAPASGTVTLTTAGSTFNTLLAVYTGPNVSNLTRVASVINPVGSSNALSFIANSNLTYHIAVDGLNGASSRILLALNLAGGLPIPSGPATLYALPSFADGTSRFALEAEPNRTYVIECSTDLISWTTLKTVTTGPQGWLEVLDATADEVNARYYRCRAQ